MKENKLIAEFMGLETPDGVYFEYLTKDGERSKLTHFMLLEYHLSWDWLMPVVEKCCILNNEEGFEPFYDLCELKIATTYKAVVEFIKNQNT